jgi:dolichyl-phosphate-mannose-protein mannosyltransferase
VKIHSKILKTSLIIYLFCQVFFLINIQYPATPNFDEFHYIPSAKQFLELVVNQNYEHPPLGKLIMAAGIGVFGDNPLGWRVMSTLFGALTCVGMYLFAFVLFQSEQAALWTAILTLANQLLFVQARIGMLDTFMFTFIIGGLTAFCASFGHIPGLKGKEGSLLSLAGAFFGFAMACKWFGIITWVSCVGFFVVTQVLHQRKIRLPIYLGENGFQGSQWKNLSWLTFIIALVILPLLTYFSTFIPFLFLDYPNPNDANWFTMQWKMWDGQLRVVSDHPYNSAWWGWPLMIRPIWYAFDRNALNPNLVRGVLLLGNPLLMWGGLVAMLICFYDGWIKRVHSAFIISFFYLAFTFCWALIPRKIAFYYYYYPSGMILSFAWAYLFWSNQASTFKLLNGLRWWILLLSIAFFVYFYPILAALEVPADSFTLWAWFRSWI